MGREMMVRLGGFFMSGLRGGYGRGALPSAPKMARLCDSASPVSSGGGELASVKPWTIRVSSKHGLCVDEEKRVSQGISFCLLSLLFTVLFSFFSSV